MGYRILADAVLILHLGFVLFALFGGLLVLHWRRTIWLHLPAVLWAAAIEFFGWFCPLTPLENWLRAKGGAPVYQEDFIEHYIVPLLYPEALSRNLQIILGSIVLVINVIVYWRFLSQKSKDHLPNG
jgi:hypothetical protein